MDISVAFSFSNRQTECIFIATTFAKELKTSYRITPVLGVRGVAKVQAAEACMAAHSMAGLLSHPVQLPALQGQRHLPRSSLTWRTQPSPTDSPGERENVVRMRERIRIALQVPSPLSVPAAAESVCFCLQATHKSRAQALSGDRILSPGGSDERPCLPLLPE